MKRSPRFVIFIAFLAIAWTSVANARLVRMWSHRELLEKCELAVVAIPIATHDTKERRPMPVPGFESQSVIGVLTEFEVVSFLKGFRTSKTVLLHHYRADKKETIAALTFLSFDPKKKQKFRLYLVREAQGPNEPHELYEPVAGHFSPEISVREEAAN